MVLKLVPGSNQVRRAASAGFGAMTNSYGLSRQEGRAEPPASAPARYRGRSVAAAGVAGFASGIVFWHLVGFWSLVNEAMLHHNPADGPAPAPARLIAAKSQGRQSGASGPMPSANEACTVAMPGPDGTVRAGACAAIALRFAPARGIERADFADFGSAPATTLINGAGATPTPGAPAVGGWAAEVAPSAKP